MPYVIAAILLLAILVIVIIRKSRHYGRIFNDEHYAEITRWASEVIKKHPVEKSSIDDGTAVVTRGGLAIAYTSVNNGSNRSIHFSVSQHGGYTTGAVGGRVLFLLIRLLHKNKCEGNLFRTETTVHHAVFSMPVDKEWVMEVPEAVVADMAKYQPLPIAAVNVAQPAAAPNVGPAEPSGNSGAGGGPPSVS